MHEVHNQGNPTELSRLYDDVMLLAEEQRRAETAALERWDICNLAEIAIKGGNSAAARQLLDLVKQLQVDAGMISPDYED